MSENPVIQPSIDTRGISRRMMVRATAVGALLLVGVGTVQGLQSWLNASFDKPAAPLQKDLDQISKTLGSPVRYQAVPGDMALSSEEVDTLGTTKYLLRNYRDRDIPNGQVGSLVNLNVNYYATGSSTPHVPDNCWIANGLEQVSAEVFEVPGVKRLDGTTTTLRVNLLCFKVPRSLEVPDPDALRSTDGDPMYQTVAYMFHVNGQYVATVREVTRSFWKMENNYAYHAKIEVTPRTPCSKKQAIQIVGDFLKDAVASIEECLPDPAILTKSSTKGS